jgi:hypothetical protein
MCQDKSDKFCKENWVWVVVGAFAFALFIGIMSTAISIVSHDHALALNHTDPCVSNQCMIASFDGETCHRHHKDFVPCDDQDVCTKDDTCFRGECRGRPFCAGHDPCQILKCRPEKNHFGPQLCTVAETLLECRGGCIHDGMCGIGYHCISGTCKQHANMIEDDNLVIRGLTQKDCGGGRWRLVIDLTYISLVYRYGTSDRSRRLTSTKGILAQWPHEFIHSIRHLQWVEHNQTMHSGFTIWTQCAELNKDNCDTHYANRKYRFALDITECAHGTNQCEQEFTGQSFEIVSNYVNCGPFALGAVSPTVPSLHISPGNDTHITVQAYGWEPKFELVYLCVVDKLERMAPCARNDNLTVCPRRGCDWAGDSPIMRPGNIPTKVLIWNASDPQGQPTPQGQYVGAEISNGILRFATWTFQPLDEIVVDAVVRRGDIGTREISSTG